MSYDKRFMTKEAQIVLDIMLHDLNSFHQTYLHLSALEEKLRQRKNYDSAMEVLNAKQK